MLDVLYECHGYRRQLSERERERDANLDEYRLGSIQLRSWNRDDTISFNITIPR